jgi:Family of unknown function (DUF6209)
MNRALFLSIFTLAACGPQEAEVASGGDEAFELDAAPLLGIGGGDQAERGCNVILRSAERDGLNCASTGCWWVFKGVLDVSETAVAEGARPYVLAKNLDASSWTKFSATRTSGAPAGFTRYTFRATRNTLTDGMSATAYQRAYVELAPYLLTKNGARLFDHNRNADAFANYRLDLKHGWQIAPDETTCGPRPLQAPRVAFSAAWQTAQRGALVAGQPFVLDYAIERLETCRGTHNGYPAWDLRAFVRFSPSGAVIDGSVRGFSSPTGTPSNSNAVSAPLSVEIPAGTTGLEVWFQNFTGAGSSCVAWDSAQGANYAFAVEPRLPAPVQWEGNAGSSFSRTCAREAGVPASVSFDSYLQQRACSFVEVDVYVPGLTDGAASKPWAILAETELGLDGARLAPAAMTFVGRFGNDYRYRFEVPRSELYYGPKWTTLTYAPRFSTDGRAWTQEPSRTIIRDVSFCNPAWASCAL